VARKVQISMLSG